MSITTGISNADFVPREGTGEGGLRLGLAQGGQKGTRARRTNTLGTSISLVCQNHVLESGRRLNLRRRRCRRGSAAGGSSSSSRSVHDRRRGSSGRSGGYGGRSLGNRLQRNGGPFANLQLFFLEGLTRRSKREGEICKKEARIT